MEKRILILVISVFIALTASTRRITYIYKGVSFKCKLDNNIATITAFDVDVDSVVIPSQVEYDGNYYPVKTISTHREGCNYVAKSLLIEEGVEKIDNFAFKEFRNLCNVYLPTSIRNIGRVAFRSNKKMVFYLPPSLKNSSLWDWGIARVMEVIPKEVANKTLANSSHTVSQFAANDGRVAAKRSNHNPVDENIPVTGIKNSHTYCAIIANENYEEAPNVDYAKNDGTVFAQYCQLTLGIPANQIRLYIDAGYNDIQKALRFIETTQEIDKEAKIIFYYSGHGIPSENDHTAYLLPVDGSPKDIQTGFNLKQLYDRLGNVKAQSIVVLLDACFSGTNKSNGEALFAARSIVRVKQESASGNMVVISAASGEETALPLSDAHHGLFTYHLLKELRNSKGKITLGELFANLKQNVLKSSILDNDKKQTPTVTCSPVMDGKWKNIYF